jgi:hypothetical protein
MAEDALDNGQELRVVGLDIKSAFDSVWHAGLLTKLSQIGVDGRLHAWLKDYITNRYQQVLYNGTCSGKLLVRAGVPQGSILGPLLFNIYINDMMDTVRNSGVLFADDATLFALIENSDSRSAVARSLCDDVYALSEWAERWQVAFSASKFQLLTISRKQDKVANEPIYYRDNAVEECDALKLLGVTLTKTLDWSCHVNDVAMKASRAYGALSRASPFLSEAARLTVFKSIVRPIMEYASPIWSGATEVALKGLERVQRRCLKLCPSQDVLDSLTHRRQVSDLSVYHSIIHRKAPSIVSDLAPPPIERARNTRQA